MAKEFDIALSFAGEDRIYVQQVADALRLLGVRVFYDLYEEASLWGKDLYVHLRNVYQRDAKFTVMFISAAYAAKLWTSHERQSAQARAFGESREYILPARFDDTEVPGLPPTIGYVDLRLKSPSELSKLILEKLQTIAVTPDSLPPRHGLIGNYASPKEPAIFTATFCENEELSQLQIAIDPLRYRSAGELLDDIYSFYLSSYLKPFTYGEQWLIRGEPFHMNLLVPWQWVLSPGQAVHELAPEWNSTPLTNIGIVTGSHWEITPTKEAGEMIWQSCPSRAYVFGTDDERLWKLVLSKAKAIALLDRKKYIQEAELNASTATCRRYHGVFEDWLGIGSGCALLHTGHPVSDEIYAQFRY